MSFSRELRNRSRASWDLMCRHPFVQAIGDGTLSLPRFRFFMRQDYLFLIEYARVLAMAAARAPDLESMGRFAGLLHETLGSEMELHRGFCTDFGITPRQLESTRAAPATLAYTRFLLDVASKGGIEEIAAALLPCQWSYDEIGRDLARRARTAAGSFHRRWIEGYSSAEYRAVTGWLVGFVDLVGGRAGPGTVARLHEVFEESCRHELLFWEAAWESARR